MHKDPDSSPRHRLRALLVHPSALMHSELFLRLLEDHWNPVHYRLPDPGENRTDRVDRNDLYVHVPLRRSRSEASPA